MQDTHISTYLAVVIDAFGAIPTLIKTYRQPETESYPQWILAAGAGLLTLFAVPRFELVLVIYPAYVFVADGLVAVVKYSRMKQMLL